ncbi:N-acetylmuramoyl-L-alanine amidase [Quadrisphaera sp. DSM 44207]|uniref:N-acetylmuramoyl-L-alanine amidase n=1 Tax=Quadrisphaera sp. DSM 44207 TaxID=1881057 RepID=UPI000885E707|nr:N-acetylmuramoyl-L-alanine amidase [Quadrisphaera sp. DSM 44207]SDQ09638.1 N-acetylmuramoyl-L-alanine amidase [Quadrisphaera sp. DSM 44207]
MSVRRPLTVASLVLALTALPVVDLPAVAVQPHPVPTGVDVVPLADDPGQEVTEDRDAARGTSTFTVVPEEGADLLGVTWEEGAAASTAWVRVHEDGAWGAWTALPVDDEGGPDAGTPEAAQARPGTEPLWVGGADEVQVRLAERAADGAALAVVDTATSAADGVGTTGPLARAEAAPAGAPVVHSRAQWGADESLRTCTPSYSSQLQAAVVHHTADANNAYSREQVPAMLRSIYAYHVSARGWCDVGYNALVDRFGRIWEGRAGGIERGVVGAHAGGFNTGTFGVSMIGNYSTEAPPAAMLEAVSQVVAWKAYLNDFDPRGTARLTAAASSATTARYPAGQVVTVPAVLGHRDVGLTECPGNAGYAKLGQVRDRAAELVRTSGYVEVSGEARAVWMASGGAGGYLGHPTGYGRATAAGGWAQDFDRGTIAWSPATGAHAVKGQIDALWAQEGESTSFLGYPVAEERCGLAGGGCTQAFQRGTIAWTPAIGARSVKGEMNASWTGDGAQAGYLGYPTAAERCGLPGGGCSQAFERGATSWSPATGAVRVKGSIEDVWTGEGAHAGYLGHPTANERCGLAGGGCTQRFERGTVAWSPATGARSVKGSIDASWRADGAQAGYLGYPTAPERCGLAGGGCTQAFERGTIAWSPATGASRVKGQIDAAWRAGGAQDGALGYPTGEELLTAVGWTQAFQTGRITVTRDGRTLLT